MLNTIFRYTLSCGILLLPVSVWNIVLSAQLPPAFSPAIFWRDISPALAFAENSLRIIVFAMPFFMPLKLSGPGSRRGLLLYAVGTVIYFASWLVLIYAPASAWSVSAFGFVAPAYTPLLWLLGIALTGRQLFWGRFYRWWMYLVPAMAFLVAHIGHTALVYARMR